MKKKIKNKDLQDILNGAAHLGNYAMPGDLTLAIISARKQISSAYENYNEACKQVGETRCERDKQGLPITEYQKDVLGKDLIEQPKKLKFKDAATEAKAIGELRKLGEQTVEIEVKEFDQTIIGSLISITPIQMEVLMWLTEIKSKK